MTVLDADRLRFGAVFTLDVAAGLTAGVRTVWLSHGRTKPFADEPWKTVANMDELTGLLTLPPA